MFRYVVSGLSVESDLCFGGLVPSGAESDEPDVRIRAGAVPVTLAKASSCGPNWALAADRFLIAIPGIVRMLLIEGRELRYEIDAGVTTDDAAVFLSGTGFGILLHQRRQILLHASAVRVGERAVLFCGPSGAGKSTLAAALASRGHDLLADDFCSLSMACSGGVLVRPDSRQLKLWRNAIDNLALGARTAAPVRPQLQKYYVEPPSATRSALPLAAIYVLREARPPETPRIARSNIVDGALLIRANAYRPAMVRRMGQEGLYFQAAATIARQASIFRLSRELGFDKMPMLIANLEAHWEELGLTEMAA
jgi:hypothetical protein